MKPTALDNLIHWIMMIERIDDMDMSEDPLAGTCTIAYEGEPIIQWDQDTGKASIIHSDKSDRVIFMYLISQLNLVASDPTGE